MAQEIAAKRLKTSPPTIGTHKSVGPLVYLECLDGKQLADSHHSGHFHADEALAVYLLRILPSYTSSSLIRTRDPALLATCHTVVDVGGEYSPPTNRYDHHQRTFDVTFPNHTTKLSSAGLVYMHFGRSIIAQKTKLPESSAEVSTLYEKIYSDFVEALDAHDNGISVYDPSETAPLKKRFNDGGVTLGSLVNDLNNDFDEIGDGRAEGTTSEDMDAATRPTDPTSTADLQAAEDSRFLRASKLMGTTFLRKLAYYHQTWLPAFNTVSAAYASRARYHASRQIVVFESGGVPWKDHLYALEAEHPEEPKICYVLYPESPQEGAKWRIQCVPVDKESFVSRKPLKEEWRGLRDDELSQKMGIDGGVFVHASGFIGGNATKGGAFDMAKKMLDN
ncbi:hypothetical protein MMC25_005406 [Agyrium rufum]|nr:hypothetical protein [Agyrium rufum]